MCFSIKYSTFHHFLFFFLPGHYYYFYYPNNYETYTLEFPNYQYICDLSFAYAVDGATTFRLSRWNFDQIDINTTLAAGAPNITGPWSRAHHHFTLPALNATYPLYFEQLLVDMGEAPPTNEEIFLALDDINITFCLPCHFDSLSAEGNMVLDAPDRIPIQVAALIRTNISANSSICPNATFVYTIEAGKQNQFVNFFGDAFGHNHLSTLSP